MDVPLAVSSCFALVLVSGCATQEPCTPETLADALLLSETACVDRRDPTVPVEGFQPVAVNAELWSDGADKQRWMMVPAGGGIEVDEVHDWHLPAGTVLIKSFALDGAVFETRFIAYESDSSWVGYSFRHDDDGKDGALLTDDLSAEVAGQEWPFPVTECDECHTDEAGVALGPETAQLNRAADEGAGDNQLEVLDALGWFVEPIGDPESLPALVEPFGDGALEDRARAYLHANCASCHFGDHPVMDLRYFVALEDMDACGEDARKPPGGYKRIAPGDPSKSALSLSMQGEGNFRMPELGTNIIDDQGIALIDEWISSIESCP